MMNGYTLNEVPCLERLLEEKHNTDPVKLIISIAIFMAHIQLNTILRFHQTITTKPGNVKRRPTTIIPSVLQP